MSGYQVVRVCSLAALGDPGAREFFSGEGDWPHSGFVVQVRGQLRAYTNVCPHKRHPLNIDDDDFLVPKLRLLRCSSHGALFEPETGLCIHGPCAGHALNSLECWVEGDEVLVRAPVSA